MTMVSWFAPGGLALGTLVALSAPSESAAPAERSAPPDPLPIYGGDFVSPCGWPTAVSLGGGCTGTLVHPQVVIYAAHCGASVPSVQFGESILPAHARTVAVRTCDTWPDGLIPGAGVDWAYCILAEPQDDIPIVPPLMGCEVDILQPGQPVTLVGFGASQTGYGQKRAATTELGYLDGNEAFIGGDGVDSCSGDSGGPVFVRLPQSGSWRVFGITSYGAQNCGDGGFYSMMHPGMPWFEAASGFDLTPCHDSWGNWEPGPGCTGFPTDPQAGTATWSDGCGPGPSAGLETSCGAPFDSDLDIDAPTVEFIAPVPATRFDTDAPDETADIAVEVFASDEDSGVDRVELRVDNVPVDDMVSSAAPHRFALSLPSGTYRLDALGIDGQGNVGVAPPVFIGVNVDAAPPRSADTSSGSGGDDSETSETDAAGVTDAQGCSCRSPREGRSTWPSLATLLLVGFRARKPRKNLVRLRS